MFYLPPPSKKSAVTAALRDAYQESQQEYQQRAIGWAFAHFFMQGQRSWGSNLAMPGLPSQTRRDDKKRRRVRHEKALVQAQTEMGRVLGIDLWPKIRRRPGLSLDTVREDAVCGALCDDAARWMLRPQLLISQAYQLVTYGTVGGLVHQPADPTAWRPALSLVPAWEMRPLPGNMTSADQVLTGGISWCQYVNIDWLKSRYSDLIKLGKRDDITSLLKEAVFGKQLAVEGSPQNFNLIWGGIGSAATLANATAGTASGGTPADADMTTYGEMREHWLFTDGGHVQRYIMQIGDTDPLIDADFTSDEWRRIIGDILPTTPWGLSRYYEVGSFWGRGFVDKLLPLNREVELLLADWLDNLRTRDALTFLAMPGSLGISMSRMAEFRKNKLITYTPDASAPSARPEIIAPPNTGDALGKAIAILDGAQNDLTAQGELIYGGVPKRLESAKSLAMVGAYQNVPMAVCSKSLAAAYSDIWRGTLGYIRYQHKVRGKQIKTAVMRLDEMSLGLTIDPKTAEISLADYAIGDPANIDTTIRSEIPRDEDIILQQILLFKDKGLMTTSECMIDIVTEGLNLPRVSRAPYNNWLNAWRENIILYNDGRSPGTIDCDTSVENNLIHFLVIDELVQSAYYTVAEPAVQAVLKQHRQRHYDALPHLPEQMPGVDTLGQPQQFNPGLGQQVGMVPPLSMDSTMNTL